uniref:dTDP-4-dehydrorhamnose reductase n=1 Tax=candidate division WOR-3 bacterium TaxID=2052148 RepID=A0A7C4XNP2_UNCW3
MKVFITGADGGLGSEVRNLLKREKINFLGVDIKQLDITDFKKTNEVILNYQPDVILHFAAISNVDECERNKELALRTNSLSTLGLVTIAKKIGAKFLYTSTSFVFDGYAEEPYFEYSTPNPICEYGRTKLIGENFIKEVYDRFYIVRTSWLFGENSKTFISKFLKTEEKPHSINIICDQFGSFTYIPDLAEAIFLLIKSENYGTYHLTNSGFGTWLDFALKAKDLMKFNTELIPTKLEELNLPAPRPRFAPLGSRNYEFFFEKKMRPWQDALTDFIRILQ